MRIVVDKLPKEPKECLFAITLCTDKDVRSNCTFLHNKRYFDETMTFHYSEGYETCVLHSGKRCPFLTTHTQQHIIKEVLNKNKGDS